MEKISYYCTIAIIAFACFGIAYALGCQSSRTAIDAQNYKISKLQSLNTRYYEAACLQADFIRYIKDHFDNETTCANIGSEIEECYYEFFEGLDSGYFNTKQITNVSDFEEFAWCY